MDMVALPFCQISISIDRSRLESVLPPPSTIGEHIRSFRLKRNLFQKEVAYILNVTTSSVENWERNQTKPRLELLPKIFDLLGYIPERYKDKTRLQSPIFRFRARHGLGVKAMACLLGVDTSTVYLLECGKMRLTKRMRIKIKTKVNQFGSVAFVKNQ
jgi:transcriptional regulator with XRE-family HTH domain